MTGVCRFAPSTTGPAHPGTLLAALLGELVGMRCWHGSTLVVSMHSSFCASKISTLSVVPPSTTRP